MPRVIVVLVLGVLIAATALIGNFHFLGLIVGLLAGVVFLLIGIARGGGLPEASIGMYGEKRRGGDPNTGIGTALAASGIACSVVGDSHFPAPFRIFYGVCIGAGILIALYLAWRNRLKTE